MFRPPLLLVLSGLPGVGKTTLARRVVPSLNCVYLRVDEVEAPLIRSNVDVGGLGYEAVAGLARSNLDLGRDVAVDLVNPLPLTRAMWRDAAARTGAKLVAVECVLADRSEHRRRVVSRSADLEGIAPPTWAQVEAREYVPWDESRDGKRLRLDMADLDAAAASLIEAALAEAAPVGAVAALDAGGLDEKAFSRISSKSGSSKAQNATSVAGVASQLRAREPLCCRKEFVDSAESFDACMAEGFRGIGASGSVYGCDDVRRTALDNLSEETDCMPGQAWEVSDFRVERLGGETYLVTYRLDQTGRVTRRATIWRDDAGQWTALYHQGTMVKAGDEESERGRGA